MGLNLNFCIRSCPNRVPQGPGAACRSGRLLRGSIPGKSAGGVLHGGLTSCNGGTGLGNG